MLFGIYEKFFDVIDRSAWIKTASTPNAFTSASRHPLELLNYYSELRFSHRKFTANEST